MTPDNDTRKELESISPVLSRLSKTNPYIVPPGYFEQLPSAMLAQVKQAKVVVMAPKRNIWRLAVAAAIAGAVILGAWLLMDKQSSVDTLAQVNDVSVQKQMQQVSETEMADYVDRNDIIPAEDISSAPISAEDVQLVLADVSDQELQQYLDQENVSANLN
jgi:hypothetical protein